MSTDTFPTKTQWLAMLWSFLRVSVTAFLVTMVTAGGFNDVDWTAALWSAVGGAAVVLVNFLNANDARYGRGAS